MTTVIRRPKSDEDDWNKRLAALLAELKGLPDSYVFTGTIHRGGVAAFEVGFDPRGK